MFESGKKIVNQMVIRLLKNYNIAKIENYDAEGDCISKYCDIDSLRNVISSGEDFDTPLLPDNCVYYKNLGDKEIVCQFIPAHQRKIRRTLPVYKIKTSTLPFPNLLITSIVGFEHNPNGSAVKTVLSSKMVAVKSTRLMSKNTELYVFPYSNVYKNTDICFGNNEDKLSYYNDVSQLSDLPLLFLNGIFNKDLSFVKTTNGKSATTVMNDLEGENIFPPSLLLKYKNFNEYIKELQI